jgi:hypothetical protein
MKSKCERSNIFDFCLEGLEIWNDSNRVSRHDPFPAYLQILNQIDCHKAAAIFATVSYFISVSQKWNNS